MVVRSDGFRGYRTGGLLYHYYFDQVIINTLISQF